MPSASPSTKPPAHRSFDVALFSLGDPGTGKSTWLLLRCLELARTTPAYLLAHDPDDRIPERHPDGQELPVVRVETCAAARAHLAEHGGGSCLAIRQATSEEVIELGCSIAATSRAEHGGVAGFPCIVLLDEGVHLMASAGARNLEERLAQVMTGRRHLGVGLAITCQDAGLVNKRLLIYATEVAIHRTGDEATLRRLRQIGVPVAVLEQIPALPPHHRYVHKR